MLTESSSPARPPQPPNEEDRHVHAHLQFLQQAHRSGNGCAHACDDQQRAGLCDPRDNAYHRRQRHRGIGAAAGLLRRNRQWRHLPELRWRVVPAAIRGLPGHLYRRQPTPLIIKTEPQAKRTDMKHGNLLRYRLTVVTSAMAMLVTLPISAQQINGTPGSPSATQVIKGHQIPAPPLPFGGVIK